MTKITCLKSSRYAVILFVLGLIFLIGRRQLIESTWVPMGADWDSWLQSAVSIRFGGSYPMVRWPLYGAVVAIVDFILPTPLHISAQILSMAATVGSAVGVFWVFSSGLNSPKWGVVGWFVTIMFPLNLCFSDWCSSYALWGCSCVWTVICLFELYRRQKWQWAIGAGFGSVFSLAIMAKGLVLGLFFILFSVVVLLISKGHKVKSTIAFCLPLALLFSLYAGFPHSLKSLDAHVASVDFARDRPLVDKHIYDPTQDPHAYGSKGYVFGQSMSFDKISDALQSSANSLSPEKRKQNFHRSRQIIQTAFPKLKNWVFVYIALGWLSLMILLRRQWILWCGFAAVIISVLPSVFVEFNMRFLIPGTAVLSVFWVAPFALLSRHIKAVWGQALLVGSFSFLCYISPYSDYRATSEWLDPLLVRGKQGIWLESKLPEGTINVVAPPSIGVPISGSRGGNLIVPGSSKLDEPFKIPSDEFVLLWIDFPAWAPTGEEFTISPMMPPFPDGLTNLEGRMVLEHHPLFQGGAGVALLGELQ